MFEDSFEMDENPTRMQRTERWKSSGRWMGFDELDNHETVKPSRSQEMSYEDEEDYKVYSRRDPKRDVRKNHRRKDKWGEQWDY